MRRKVKVYIKSGNKTEKVLVTRMPRFISFLVRCFYGKCAKTVVLMPGSSVSGIEICDRKDGAADE